MQARHHVNGSAYADLEWEEMGSEMVVANQYCNLSGRSGRRESSVRKKLRQRRTLLQRLLRWSVRRATMIVNVAASVAVTEKVIAIAMRA